MTRLFVLIGNLYTINGVFFLCSAYFWPLIKHLQMKYTYISALYNLVKMYTNIQLLSFFHNCFFYNSNQFNSIQFNSFSGSRRGREQRLPSLDLRLIVAIRCCFFLCFAYLLVWHCINEFSPELWIISTQIGVVFQVEP